VRYILEGSVRKSGDRLRITGQLVDTATGNQIWADKYDGAQRDIFDLQDSITSNVVVVIEPKVRQVEISRAQAKPTESLTAYDLYLRALTLTSEYKVEAQIQALALLERAVAIDPTFSSAHGLIASGYTHQFFLSVSNAAGEYKARGLQAARRAVETGRDNAEALARGGYAIARLGERPEEGLQHLNRALALNPNSVAAVRYAGMAFLMVGNHEQAMTLYEQAMRLSPLDPWVVFTYDGRALIHLLAGDFEEAIGWADKAHRERPEYLVPLFLKVAAMAGADRAPKEVEEVVQHLLTIQPKASIEALRQRMGGYRRIDVEALTAALRKAGLPE
jgi:tetratricopeptide (TPR) repeat protein